MKGSTQFSAYPQVHINNHISRLSHFLPQQCHPSSHSDQRVSFDIFTFPLLSIPPPSTQNPVIFQTIPYPLPILLSQVRLSILLDQKYNSLQLDFLPPAFLFSSTTCSQQSHMKDYFSAYSALLWIITGPLFLSHNKSYLNVSMSSIRGVIQKLLYKRLILNTYIAINFYIYFTTDYNKTL